MRAGPLRHRIVIERPYRTQDSETGATTIIWIQWAKPNARIEPLSVRDFMAAQTMQSAVAARIIIRYINGLKPEMRIKYRDKIYAILGVLPDIKSGFEYLTIAVSEGVRYD